MLSSSRPKIPRRPRPHTRVHSTSAYDGRKTTIKDLNFTASPGQKIALVGETGGGKSKILKLLFRFYDVSAGSVKIDNQNVRDVALQSLRQAMGVVPQHPVLVNDTVMNRQGAASPQSSSCSFVFLSDLMKPQQHSSQSLVTSSVKIDDQDVRDVTLQSLRHGGCPARSCSIQ